MIGVYGGLILAAIGYLVLRQDKQRAQQKKEHDDLVDAIHGREATPPAPVESSSPTEPAAPHHHSSSALSRWRARQ